MTLTTRPGEPGLVVESWISNSTDFLAVIAQLYGARAGADVRLYPTGLEEQTERNKTLISYRAVVGALDARPNGGVFSQECITWFAVGNRMYGSVGVDEIAFEVGRQGVVSVVPRVLRTALRKL